MTKLKKEKRNPSRAARVRPALKECPDEVFQMASKKILAKNKELYERLAARDLGLTLEEYRDFWKMNSRAKQIDKAKVERKEAKCGV